MTETSNVDKSSKSPEAAQDTEGYTHKPNADSIVQGNTQKANADSNVEEDTRKPNADNNEESGILEDTNLSPGKEKVEKVEEEVEEVLSEDVKKQNHEEALGLKESGNILFKEANYQLAVDKYSDGIKLCPKSYTKTLSVLHSNRAACLIKLDEKEQAILDCTAALEFDQYYTKARLRRAQTYEVLDKLDDALKDYNEILKYDKSCQAAGEAAMRLPGQINERNEKLKEEMFGKLKELGNMCLKPFGLSTNNFQLNQDPTSGGYSVNFQR